MSPFIFPLTLIIRSLSLLPFCLFPLSFSSTVTTPPPRCSDGSPALFPCIPSTMLLGPGVSFICAADTSLGCEQFDAGQFLCCARRSAEKMALLKDDQTGMNTTSAELPGGMDDVGTVSSTPSTGTDTMRSSSSPASLSFSSPSSPSAPISAKMALSVVDGSAEDSSSTLPPNGTTSADPPPLSPVTKFTNFSSSQTPPPPPPSSSSVPPSSSSFTTSPPTPSSSLPSSSSASVAKSTRSPPASGLLMPCVDAFPQQCSLAQQLCHNPRYSRLLHLQCPRTCNVCMAAKGEGKEGIECTDRGKDCGRVEFLCRTKAYGAMMAEDCSKTCRKCGIMEETGGRGREEEEEDEEVNERRKEVDEKKRGREEGKMEAKEERKEEGEEHCVDNYPRCAVWGLQGFCTSSKYTKFLKRRYCAKTCTICKEKHL